MFLLLIGNGYNVNNKSNREFIWGVRSLLLAGAIPTVVGTIYFIRAFKSLYQLYYEAFILNILPDNNLIHLIPTHIGAVNLMLSGLTLVVVTNYGIRNKLKWAYKLNFTIYLWMGFHDLLGTVLLFKLRMMPIPTPIFPLFFGGIGFFLTYTAIFKDNKS